MKATAWAVAAALSLCEVSPARAQDDESRPTNRRLWVAARGAAGLGIGRGDVGGQLAASVTGWPLARVGATVEYSDDTDGALFGRSEEFQLLSLGPSFRTDTRRFYVQGDLLVGAGGGHRLESDGLLSTEARERLSGLAVTANVGLFFHPACLELGPAFSFTRFSGTNLMTLNFELGFAL